MLLLLACAGCTDRLVGFRATFASNTIAVRAEPPSGERLRFRVPKHTTDLAKRTVYLQPQRAILHVAGYLPITPDAVDDAGDAYLVTMTLPKDLVKHASGALPNTVHLNGNLYLPAEVGMMSFTRAEIRVPTAARTLGVSMDAVHAGPMTRLAERIGGFLRGLYSAR
jgi:hypothetical protein